MTQSVALFWRGKSASEIADYVEENLIYVAEHLRTELTDSKQDGAKCPFEIDEEDDPYVRRTEGIDPDLLVKLKAIDPLDFEKVCARLLDALGGSSFVTPPGPDGGIDFVSSGIDILPEGITAPAHCHAAVIGQAKRYKERLVAERALREFIGATLVKRHELRVSRTIGPLTPVLLAFWTTANFEPNCKIFARKAGVWLMDGMTLADYIARLGLKDWVLSLPDDPRESSTA